MNMKGNANRILNRFRLKTGYNYRDKQGFNYRKQLSKIIICLIIIIVILVLKKVNINFTNKIIRIVDNTLNYTYDIKEDSIEVFNFVKDKLKITNEAIPVYESDISLFEKANTFNFFL